MAEAGWRGRLQLKAMTIDVWRCLRYFPTSSSDDNEDSEGANSASSDNASTSEPDNAGVTAARAAMAAKLDTEER